jgi:hypothetical protein
MIENRADQDSSWFSTKTIRRPGHPRLLPTIVICRIRRAPKIDPALTHFLERCRQAFVKPARNKVTHISWVRIFHCHVDLGNNFYGRACRAVSGGPSRRGRPPITCRRCSSCGRLRPNAKYLPRGRDGAAPLQAVVFHGLREKRHQTCTSAEGFYREIGRAWTN